MQEFEADEEAITGINVTPLVDIILVLLIIFMVTARFISEPTIGVNLPKTGKSANPTDADSNIFLTINQKRQIFLNNRAVLDAELPAAIRALLKEKPNMNLVLRADSSVPHGEVISVLDVVRAEGVTQFGIAVEGNPPK